MADPKHPPGKPHIDNWTGVPAAEPDAIDKQRRQTDKLADRVIAADKSSGASDKSPFSSARDMKRRGHEQHAPTTGDSHVKDSLPKSPFVDPLSRRWTGK